MLPGFVAFGLALLAQLAAADAAPAHGALRGRSTPQAAPSASAAEVLRELFGTVGSGDTPGGLLIRKHSEFPVRDGALDFRRALGGIGFTRRSSWTYWRKDLVPFNAESDDSHSPIVMVLLNASAAWSMVDGMYPTDASTVARSGCSVYSPQPVSVPFSAFNGMSCAQHALRDAGVGPEDNISLVSCAGNMTTDCPVDDRACRLVRAGGSMSMEFWLNLPSCTDPGTAIFENFASCFDVRESSGSAGESGRSVEVKINGPCAACRSPQVCVLEDAPSGTLLLESPPTLYNGTAKEFQTFVGKDARLWTDLFMSQTAWKFQPYGKNENVFMKRQCIFKKEDAGGWISAQHEIYRLMLEEMLRANSSMLSEPEVNLQLENEVPIYVQPEEHGRWDAQEKLILDSVVALAVDTLLPSVAPSLELAKNVQDHLQRMTGRAIPICKVRSPGPNLPKKELMEAALSAQGVAPESVIETCSA